MGKYYKPWYKYYPRRLLAVGAGLGGAYLGIGRYSDVRKGFLHSWRKKDLYWKKKALGRVGSNPPGSNRTGSNPGHIISVNPGPGVPLKKNLRKFTNVGYRHYGNARKSVRFFK